MNNDYEQILSDATAHLQCILCGEQSFLVGVFIPDDILRKQMNVPDGKFRHIVYRLCEDCHGGANYLLRIEEKILSGMNCAQSRHAWKH